MSFMRNQISGRSSPDFLPGFSVEAQDDETVFRIGMFDSKDPLGLVFGFRQGRINLSGIHRGKQEDLVYPKPQDWRRLVHQ